MDTLIPYIIMAVFGLAILFSAITPSEKLKVGDYATVRFTRRRGSTTEWKEGAKVKVIEVHIGKIVDGERIDYTVLMENDDIAFPLRGQLEKVDPP